MIVIVGDPLTSISAICEFNPAVIRIDLSGPRASAHLEDQLAPKMARFAELLRRFRLG